VGKGTPKREGLPIREIKGIPKRPREG